MYNVEIVTPADYARDVERPNVRVDLEAVPRVGDHLFLEIDLQPVRLVVAQVQWATAGGTLRPWRIITMNT